MLRFFGARVRNTVNSSAHLNIDHIIAVKHAFGSQDEPCNFHMSDGSICWAKKGILKWSRNWKILPLCHQKETLCATRLNQKKNDRLNDRKSLLRMVGAVPA